MHKLTSLLPNPQKTTLKGTVHPKMKTLSLITLPHVVQPCVTFVHLQNTNEDIFD